LVNIIEDWAVLEEYAGEKLGFYQLLANTEKSNACLNTKMLSQDILETAKNKSIKAGHVHKIEKRGIMGVKSPARHGFKPQIAMYY
jgi:hypothetical protein